MLKTLLIFFFKLSKFYLNFRLVAAPVITAKVEFKTPPIIRLVPLPKRNIDVTFKGASIPSLIYKMKDKIIHEVRIVY